MNLLYNDTFWLSEQPRVKGTKLDDALNIRTCVWGLFEDKAKQIKIIVVNTHLEHMIESAKL